MKTMKNLMALALAFTFVFIGASDADATGSGAYDHAGQSCDQCHGSTSDGGLGIPYANNPDIVGFEPDDACTMCHSNQGDANSTPDTQADLPGSTVNSTHSNDDCNSAGCHNATYTVPITDQHTAANGGNCQSCHNDTDNNGYSDAEEVNGITPPPANNAPVAVADSATVVAGESVDVPVLANDTDEDTTTLTVSAVGTEATLGTVTTDGTKVTYTSNGTAGNDTFTYTVTDNGGLTATGTVTITVEAAVVPPTDTDGDGLSDSKEAELGTDPTKEDTDNDTLKDGDEVNVHGTNPLKADTDGDGIYDAYDVLGETGETPADPDYGYSLEENIDTDGDGIADVDDEFPTDPTNGFTGLKPSTPSNDGTGETEEDPESTNPETGGTAGLMLSLAATTVAGAGLVVFGKKN